MPTFIYAPEIKVVVATRKNGILDLTDDLVQGVLNIRTNGVHTFNFQLQNAQRKYDAVIQPMDRIVVTMKRVTWVRVFSGYLNNGPIFSAWPRVLDLRSSCTLKRLQFWYWDSTTQAAYNLLTQGLQSQLPSQVNAAKPQTASDLDQNAATGQVSTDQGITNAVVRMLDQVVGWKPDKVHIAAMPPNFMSLADKLGDKVAKDADISDLIGDLTSTGNLGGSGAAGGTSGGLMANGTLAAGTYGGVTLSQEQANNASTIYNVGKGRGLPDKAMVIALATAMQESTLHNLPGGDRDSAGLFQQRPSAGWGTVAQVTDPVYAAGKFYDALQKINYQGMAVTVAAQTVQRSAFPSAYAKWEGMATAAEAALARSPGGSGASLATNVGAAVSNTAGAVANVVSQAAGAPISGSGRAVASTAFSLIKRNPPGHILYSLGGDAPYTDPDPRKLDCSSFVDWVYFHAVGSPIVPGGRSTAASLAAKTKDLDVPTALAVKGALVYLGGRGAEHHVEVSLGNGLTAAAHTDGIPAEQQVTVGPAGSSWSRAGLLPGVNYSDAATNQAAATKLATITGAPTTVSDPNEFGASATPGAIGAGGSDPGVSGAWAFNALINAYSWGLKQTDTMGNNLMGPLALMNDEPILPYIANLLAAGMRSWCSAPNGDFMAWFPDYFGIWNTAAKMNIRAIELMDFTVEWDDQEIVTHQYVVGTPAQTFDVSSGTVSGDTGYYWALTTKGIATMEYPGIFKAIFGHDATQQFVDDYLNRFGGRPNMMNIPVLKVGSKQEFFMALYLFMQRWANQFKANVPMTFMPELWPGMIMVLPEYKFQAYITGVQHTFSFGKGGGFHTSAQICAPARTQDQGSDVVFGLLPLGGPR